MSARKAGEDKPRQKNEIVAREEEILKFWQEREIFKKTLEKPAPKGEFVFYDGPPFATGLPHYGHIVASLIKDVVPRYFTMRGYHVPRVWGWDCHGLPIENIVEKELGFKHKKEIIAMGVAKFNERCRARVLEYASEWEKIIPRIGRWADMKNAFRTMDRPFMESVWWVFKQLWDKGLIYEDYRSMHICPRCETTLSQQEVSEGYKDVKDIAVTVKFKVKNPEKIGLSGDIFLLAWTTTPWTLPGNVALAVNPNETYRMFNWAGENYIDVKKSGYKYPGHEVKNFLGKELVGLEYEPPFGYYINDKNLKNRENGWKVYAADFVTAEEGTGIAHEAPAFGADDWELLKQVDLPFVQHVNMDGTFKTEVKDFAGMEVKPIENPTVADVEVIRYLAKKNLLFSKENITHAYPHCWRCDTPLLNYATSSWFVSVTKIKDGLLKNAKTINWSPEHIKEGRWGKWLEGARDWSISRQRFWASVMPLWVCQTCKKQRVFGSVAELEEVSGQKIDDLHKHVVDEVTFSCECGGVMRRVPDVLDTWFDSGSMPYGQAHYPFERKEEFEKTFPAQFIAEGLDQTRAWFYYLHVLAGALFNKNAFQNVIVNGIVLAEDGKKMSKKLQNYPDPMEVVGKYGADALRFYLLSSSVMQAENLSFFERGVDEAAKKHITRLNNVLVFYKLYADGVGRSVESAHVLDRWVLTRLNELIQESSEGYENYQLDRAVRPLVQFIDDLSTWWLRRSRDRFKGEPSDKKAALGVLRYVLFNLSHVMAPATPFFAEHLFQVVREEKDEESVHLMRWPEPSAVDRSILEEMARVRLATSEGLQLREEAGIKIRQPLSELKSSIKFLFKWSSQIVADEVNVKKVTYATKAALDVTMTPELKEEGMVRDIMRRVQEWRKEQGLTISDRPAHTLIASSADIEVAKKYRDKIITETGLSSLDFEIKDNV